MPIEQHQYTKLASDEAPAQPPAEAALEMLSRSLIKIFLLLFTFIWIRGTFPRYRYDQLMRLGWKVFLPFSLLWVVLTAGVLVGFGWLPGQ